MNLHGVGVDLMQAGRIERVTERHGDRFLRRVFTEQEREYCLRRSGDQYGSLAARWAAKEATFKALGGLRGATWKDVEIRRTRAGMPEVLLSGAAARRARRVGVADIKVSISHSRGTSVAFVVAARG